MNIYRTFYNSQTVDFTAASSYEAQTLAAKHFKAKKPYLVAVMLLVKDGEPVTHSAASL